jgi:hypothetical protein
MEIVGEGRAAKRESEKANAASKARERRCHAFHLGAPTQVLFRESHPSTALYALENRSALSAMTCFFQKFPGIAAFADGPAHFHDALIGRASSEEPSAGLARSWGLAVEGRP